MSELNDLKWNYNHNITRYYNGVKYLEKNPETFDKWSGEILDIQNNINILLQEIQKYQTVSEYELLHGFEI